MGKIGRVVQPNHEHKRVFLYDSSILFAHPDRLAGHMAVFISKSQAVCINSSFRFNFRIGQAPCLTRNHFDLLDPDPVS
ncbi:hypothetical protein llap_14736 [Limosa lapponica baueri]|uniref:Uncharacterized protein n=1 Tax=Limosa lapponica baueri TaxID=1758121 RepID=A0A2I0TMB6_LIMLA|nr:hypothetical protein llap_14736 [Limosa lapponica baueri]